MKKKTGTKKSSNTQFERSSGNVFADLNIPNPEEALAKAELARQINRIIKKRKLTQEEAAVELGTVQPKISALMSGKFSGFSLEKLFKFLNKLGQDVTIKIKPKQPQPALQNTCPQSPQAIVDRSKQSSYFFAFYSYKEHSKFSKY